MSAAPQLPVAAILLAAGSSRRFGPDNKLLAELRGLPLIRHVALALAGSRAREIVVVTGPDPGRIHAALDGIEARFVDNPRHLEGMGGSVAAGIAALGPDVAGALVSPGDMPGLDCQLVDRLIAAFEAAGGHRIIYPVAADGSQRNPVLWPRALFGRLAALGGEQGAKPLIGEHGTICRPVPVDRDCDLADIDTEQDLARHAADDGG